MNILTKRESDLCSWSLKQAMMTVIDNDLRKEMQVTINKLELFKSLDDDVEEE